MTQDETIEWTRRIFYWVGVFTVFIGICIAAGYFLTKLDKSPMKKNVPDCGSCRIYKEGVKK